MSKIIPAVMPQSYPDIQDHVHLVHGAADVIQLDIMDGFFVPPKTWPFAKTPSGKWQGENLNGPAIIIDRDNYWQPIQDQDIGLPLWDEIDYELDLMVQGADRYLDQWVAMGPKRIIFHLESLENVYELLQKAQSVRMLIEIGLCINNDTSIDELLPHLEMIDCVQLMGIAKVGYQGEPLDERVFEKIQSLQIHAPQLPIQIDGSVNSQTIEQLNDAGVDRFIVGSGVYGGGDAKENIETLEDLVN